MTTNYYARWLGKCHFLKPKIKKTSTMFLLFILLIGGTINAQDTFTGDNTGAAIDGSVIVESAANSNLTGTIGTDYVIGNVNIDITHPYVGDLDIKLQSPDGTILDLSLGNGGSGDDYTNTVFQDGGADITNASAPFTGTFEPEGGTFAATFDTESVNGDWKLLIEDTFPSSDDGVFNSFEITFAPPPACPEPINLSTSNITNDSVDLNWDDVANATDGFEWSVYASGDDPATATAVDTGTVGAGVTTANVTGLTPQTDYDFYISSDCGATDGDSTLAGPVTFTTLCSPFTAPSWSEDFENAGSIPDCWAQGENNAKDWEFADDGGFDHIGDDGTIGGNTASDGYFAWLDDSSPHEIGTALVSPLIDVSALTIPEVNFYLLSNNEGNSNVDFSLDVYDGTAWNDDVFFSNSNTANGEWELIEVPLSSLNITGNIIQLRFSVDENNGTDFYDDVAIDDVTVVEGPSCVKPLGLAASNLTADAVDLSWNDDPTATDGYEWVVMASGDAPDTANAVLTATATSAPANVTGLSSNTDYDAYVRSVCDAAASENSDWSNAVSFTTLCSPFTTPYSENFDGVTEPNIPNCWSTAGSMASEVITADSNFGLDDPPSAPNFLQFGDENFVDGDEAILVSPQFTDLPDADKRIRFKAAFEDGDAETHKLFIGVMSDPTDASTFVQISEITSSADASFSEYTVNLDDSALIGSNQYIAIAAGSVADFDEIAIDDFFYEDIPTCFIPQNLSVTNITASSADLNWDEEDPSSATDGYQWLIMAEGDAPDPFNAIDSGSVNNGVFTVSVNGLSPDTNYDAYVRSNCGGGDISSWTSATSFTTSIAAVVLSPGNIESEAYCYDSSEFKEWLFESSDGSPLQIEFLQGSVEVNTFSGGTYDDLIIYDGQDDTGTVLFNSDVDDVTAANLTGLTLTANSGFMYITLDSDISNSCASGAQTEIQFEVSIPQFASVQVIHNSADPAANLVDVYLNGTLLLDDFEFRTATPFVDVPAGTPIDIDIAPGTSTDVSESIFNLNTTLTVDETYVVVANGVLDPAQFDSSVNTIDFNLDIFAGAQQVSTNAGETSLLINHGSPDAPMVDVVETTLPPSTLADNMSYPEFQGYVDVPTADYVLNVETADNATVVATYEAPLQTLGLGDQAISVLASGFLDPAANQNGPAFGLWVALPAGGDLVPLPEAQNETAEVQIIHNSADPDAEFVDIYLDGTLVADDFAFRTASNFLEVPAEQAIDIDVAPQNSTDVSESIYNLNTTLTADETYVAVANGVLDPSQFDSTVNTIDFGIDVFAGAQQSSTNAGQTSVLVHHGSTDAPTVDVVNNADDAVLVDDISYTEFAGYLDLPSQDYTINVEADDNSAVVQSYEAPLQTLGLADAAITVVASGFLDPADNENGEAFGLWVALPAGGDLVELPIVEPEPAAPAPDPTEDSADVISMFSGVYTDVPVDTWLTSWSSAQLADIQIQGNDTKLYTDLDFAGAETVTNPIDASGMDFFHIDVWSPNATTFRVKLVDLASNVEGEIAFSIAQEEWVSLQIPLTDFADPALVTNPDNLLTATNSIQQVIISGLPVGAVTAYVDNVYFSTNDISTTQFNDDNFKFYPNPVVNTLNLNTSGVVENIKLYNILGQEIMNINPEIQSPQIEMGELQSGAYMMKVTIDGVSQSFRVIKK